jgi:hypothetical protein
LLIANIIEVSLTIDGIYYDVEHRLGKYTTKRHRNIFYETKTNTRELQKMIET